MRCALKPDLICAATFELARDGGCLGCPALSDMARELLSYHRKFGPPPRNQTPTMTMLREAII